MKVQRNMSNGSSHLLHGNTNRSRRTNRSRSRCPQNKHMLISLLVLAVAVGPVSLIISTFMINNEPKQTPSLMIPLVLAKPKELGKSVGGYGIQTLPNAAAVSAADADAVQQEELDFDRLHRGLEQPPFCTSKCLSSAGQNGTWTQDWDYAREHGQYPSPWVIPPKNTGTYLRFEPSPDAPYPWPTSWRWADHDHDCQVAIMTGNEMCDVLMKHDIHRILFYGDSMMELMYWAFVNKSGPDYFKKAKVQGPTFPGGGTLVCKKDNGQEYTIQVWQERDKGGNAHRLGPRGNYTIDNATQSFINSSNDRILGIFNIGAHYHKMVHYHEDMDIMLDFLAKLNRPQDMYIFRSTAPGHKKCTPNEKGFNWTKGTRDPPLSTYNDYTATTMYDWNLFEHYNHYTKDILHERSRAGQSPVMHFLDIFNMTILRSDGHTAPADCLHYHLPGAIDWWNHLLFTYLREITNANEMNCRPRFG